MDAAPVSALDVRIEPRGPSAERGVAQLGASGVARRDPSGEPGRPVATAEAESGDDAIDALVAAAALALDDTDLHLTVQRR